MIKNKKQRRIMFLLILILGITIGFALLSTTLYINGTAGIKGNTWNIHWDDTSINVVTGSVSADDPEVSTVTSTKDTVSFDVELELPGDFYEFEIDAINEGSVDGELDLAENWITYKSGGTTTTLPSYMDFKVTYDDNTTPADGDVLAHGQSKTYKIRVEFKSGVEELPSNPQPITIEVELPYVQHKDRGIKYNLGDLVYFDPVSENVCDSSTFDLNAVNSGTSTCFKWRVITPDDTESKTDIRIQLDHNIFNKPTAWTKTSSASTFVNDGSIFDETKNAAGPGGVLSILSQYTSSWTRLPLLNYTYDTSNGTCYYTDGDDNTKCQYGVLSCVNGTCKINKNNQEKELVTGLRTRLITAEEVTEITNTVADSNALSQNWTIASKGSENKYAFTGYKRIGTSEGNSSNNTDLAWLIENTMSYANGTNNVYTVPGNPGNNEGYWTLSSTSGSNNRAWFVYYDGFLDYDLRIDNYGNGLGVRPVTNIQKSMITKD